MRKKKVAFLLLEQIPQVHHLAPVAYELSRLEGIAVTVIGNPGSIEVFNKMASLYPGHKCEVIEERSRGFRRFSEWLRRRKIPRAKSILDRNFDWLMSFDMIISSDFYTHWMIEHRKDLKPQFVFGFHGAGDHSYGFLSMLKDYDYLLVSGPKIESRLKREGILDATNGLLTGYAKFDLTLSKERIKFFDDDKPVVVYNPHFNKDLSSYQDWGEKVLEFFYHNTEYNLIFAPHFNLFNKQNSGHEIPSLPSKYENVGHIKIDTGSHRSIDMSYTLNADLYLGDVSSQIYEYLYYPRPCLFLNSKDIAWEKDPNYQYWKFGPVITDVNHLEQALKDAFDTHDEYKAIQERGFNETFSRTETSAGKRAAIALEQILCEDETKG